MGRLEAMTQAAHAQAEQRYKASDRGMSLAEWQDWIVAMLIKKHDEGLSDNQLRMLFAAEFAHRFGKGRTP